MSIFKMHKLIIDEYRKYVQSFLSVSDERVRTFIEEEILSLNSLWPYALIQLNPSYETATTVVELTQQGKLHPAIADIFRLDKDRSILLYRHQQEAIIWYHRIVPLLQEYFYNGGERLRAVLGKAFVQERKFDARLFDSSPETFDTDMSHIEIKKFNADDEFLSALRHLAGIPVIEDESPA